MIWVEETSFSVVIVLLSISEYSSKLVYIRIDPYIILRHHHFMLSDLYWYSYGNSARLLYARFLYYYIIAGVTSYFSVLKEGY